MMTLMQPHVAEGEDVIYTLDRVSAQWKAGTRPAHPLPWTVMLTVMIAGCAVPPGSLDPYGRAYSVANAMEPMTLRACLKTDFDQPPALVSGTSPVYPIGELINLKVADVVLKFEVSETGRITVLDEHSDDVKWFAAHARIAMRDWVVKPASLKGTAVATRCSIQFLYGLGR